jgi:hypothetical protein
MYASEVVAVWPPVDLREKETPYPFDLRHKPHRPTAIDALNLPIECARNGRLRKLSSVSKVNSGRQLKQNTGGRLQK